MKKVILYSLLALVILFLLRLAAMFAPGSYPYAEHYEMKAGEEKVIEQIKMFKLRNSSYNIPPIGLEDGRRDSTDHWFHVYFYLKENNQIIKTWVRGGTKESTFALVAINEGLILGRWKSINKDYNSSENKKIKSDFEERILKHLNIEYTDKGNSMSIFGITF